MIGCLFDGGLCGDAHQLGRAWLAGALRRRRSLGWRSSETSLLSWSHYPNMFCFFFLLLSDKWMAQKKSKYQKKCIALHNGIPWARTRNNGPFSASCAFPLYTPMDVTSAALTIGPACSKRAWLVATTRSKVAFSSLLLYLRMTSYPVGPLAIVFFTVIVFCFFFIFPSPSPPPLFGPSCGSLMKRSPLNWKTVIKMRWVLFTSVHGGTNSTELVNQKLII